MSGRGWGAFVVVLVILHFALRLGVGLGAAAPDLLAAAVLFAAMRLGPPAVALLGLGLGLINDAFAPAHFGITGLALALIGALASFSRDYFEGSSPLFILGYLLVGTWLTMGLAQLLGRGAGVPTVELLVGNLIASAWTALAGLLLVGAYRRVADA